MGKKNSNKKYPPRTLGGKIKVVLLEIVIVFIGVMCGLYISSSTLYTIKNIRKYIPKPLRYYVNESQSGGSKKRRQRGGGLNVDRNFEWFAKKSFMDDLAGTGPALSDKVINDGSKPSIFSIGIGNYLQSFRDFSVISVLNLSEQVLGKSLPDETSGKITNLATIALIIPIVFALILVLNIVGNVICYFFGGIGYTISKNGFFEFTWLAPLILFWLLGPFAFIGSLLIFFVSFFSSLGKCEVNLEDIFKKESNAAFVVPLMAMILSFYKCIREF